MINSSYQTYLCPEPVFDRGMLDLAAARAAQLPDAHLMLESDAGAVWLELLPWDTAILEVPCARVNALFSRAGRWSTLDAMNLLDMAQRECELRAVQFVSCRITARVTALSDAFSLAGWLLRDALNVYSVASTPQRKEPDDLAELSPADLDGRFDVFATSFQHGRIHRESRISHDRAVAFYRKLFESVSAAEDAIRVGVRADRKLAGFAIGGVDRLEHYLGTNVTYLWQIGVRPEYRGRGLAAALLRGFLQHCNPAFPVEMETQFDNVAASMLFARSGIKLVANAFTYHKWISQ